MQVVMFVHSLVSDWNHGNAHFLRGVASELLARGIAVRVLEPASAWSRVNLERDHGQEAVTAFREAYPELTSEAYDREQLDLDRALDGADLVLVHEWTDPALARRIAAHRERAGRYRLLLHDTHHRALTAPHEIRALEPWRFDGVLAFGEALRAHYLEAGLAQRVWTWHEAADVRRFRPMPAAAEADLVWIGNRGDEERTEELRAYLLEPVRALGLSGTVHGVRYPRDAIVALGDAGLTYRGFLPNHRVPDAFGRHRVTVHVPRRPYALALPGIPTIRVFEALACGIPLVSAPWEDAEHLFHPGQDFLMARDPLQMRDLLRAVLAEPAAARAMAESGLTTIRARHTCAHRVDELLEIARRLGVRGASRTRGEGTPTAPSPGGR